MSDPTDALNIFFTAIIFLQRIPLSVILPSCYYNALKRFTYHTMDHSNGLC